MGGGYQDLCLSIRQSVTDTDNGTYRATSTKMGNILQVRYSMELAFFHFLKVFSFPHYQTSRMEYNAGSHH